MNIPFQEILSQQKVATEVDLHGVAVCSSQWQSILHSTSRPKKNTHTAQTRKDRGCGDTTWQDTFFETGARLRRLQVILPFQFIGREPSLRPLRGYSRSEPGEIGRVQSTY